ncbi:MAG: tetratricopeptide repeat protein [Streptosporangiaceae bacterium]|nr:tetratricopeptide repeat protein [Streptosporangiaceae bacterium]MBV9853755.1 tetratricopeptide repeat protein [Streptosporangiaceae bacterium]
MVPLRVGVLGPVTTWYGEHEVLPGQPRQQAVLCVLAVRANRVVSRGELVDAVWGQQAPVSAEGGIYTYVAGLRRKLEPDRRLRQPSQVLVSAGAGYMLRLGSGCLDADVFEQGLARARKLRSSGDLPGASRLLAEGLGLWRGIAFAGVPGPFADAERHRLSELRTAAAEERADLLLAQGQPAEALPDLTVLVAEHPLRERARGLLMVALYRCGRQAEALQVFRDARDVLAEDLGIDPGSELTRIHQQVLAMDPALDSPAAPATGPFRVVAAVPADAAPAGRAVSPASADETETAGAPAQVPLGIPGFVGRRAELQRLHAMLPGAALPGAAFSSAALSSAAVTLDGTDGAALSDATVDATVPIAAITGTAGVGKTALAIRFARNAARRFPDGQLYVNLRGFDPSGVPVEPGNALRGFFDALRVPPKRIPDTLEARIGLFRSLLDGKRMLVVLDNARTTEQVRPLLPASPGCMVVITSRSQLTGLIAAEGARALPLDVLSEEESKEVLTGRLGADRIAAEPSSATELITLSAGLPLALSVTTARAATRPGLTLAGLAAELRDARGRLDALDTGEAVTNVRAVFSWSYQQLTRPAARMFRLLGVHPGPDVSVPAAASLAAVPLAGARAQITELARSSLLTEHVPGRFTFHDLLRAYAAEQAAALEGDLELRAAEARMLDHYTQTAHAAVSRMYPARHGTTLPERLPGVVPEPLTAYEQALAWFEAEHSVLLAAAAYAAAAGLDRYCLPICWALGPYLNRHGYWHDYAATQGMALPAARRLGDPVRLGRTLIDIGHAVKQLGSLEDADSYLREALELFTELGDQSDQARAHFGLILLFDQQGRYAEGLTHAQEALRLRRALRERATLAYSENAVGWMYVRLQRYAEALPYCRRAVELHRETGARTGAADALDSMGRAYIGLGEYARAISCLQQSLAIFREISDPNGKQHALTALGDAQLAAGDAVTARDSWRRALEILESEPYWDARPVRERLSRLGEYDGAGVPMDVPVAAPRPSADALRPGAVSTAS